MSEPDLDPVLGRVDDLFAEFHAAGYAPGLAYGVVAGGRLVHSGGLGRLGTAGEPDARSVFRIASMTKSFTATALLLLRDRGLVRLDAPASDYLPELAQWRGPTSDSPVVTVRDLVTMGAGLPTDDPWGDRMESGSDEWLGRFLASGPTFATTPDTEFEYSNLGFATLGRIIARASGRSYFDFVADEVLAPLGLRDTAYDHARVDAGRRADGHRPDPDGGWETVPFSDPGAFSPMGGLFSTVADLAVWVAGMLDAFPARDGADDHPLARASRREMQRLQRLDQVSADLQLDGPSRGRRALRGSARGYGFGLFVERQTGRGDVVYHSGGYPGFGSHMRWHPVGQVGVIALANSTYAGTSRVCAPVLDVLLDHLATPTRRVRLAPATERARVAAEALVDGFDDAHADAVFAMNVDLDQPRERRRAALDAARDAAGAISDSRPLRSASPTALEWRRDGAAADQLLSVTITPEPEGRVQALTVETVARPNAVLADAAEAVHAALTAGSAAWPAQVATTSAFAADEYERAAAVATALGGPFELAPRPVRAPDPEHVRFALTGRGASWWLDLAGTADGVDAAGLVLVPELSTDPTEVVGSGQAAETSEA